MTNNKKLLIGVGVAALGLFLYYKFGKKKAVNDTPLQTPQNSNTMGALVNGTRSGTEVIRGSAGMGNTTMPTKSKEQEECEREYLRSARPAVVRTPEQEARRKDAQVKRCMEQKKASMLRK